MVSLVGYHCFTTALSSPPTARQGAAVGKGQGNGCFEQWRSRVDAYTILGADRDFVITELCLLPVSDTKMNFGRCRDMGHGPTSPRRSHSPCCDGTCCEDGDATPGSTTSRVQIRKTGWVHQCWVVVQDKDKRSWHDV